MTRVGLSSQSELTSGFLITSQDTGRVVLTDEPELKLDNHVKALWEKQIDALRGIAQAKGYMTVDMLRRGVEQLEPETYRDWSYYGKWAASICRMLLESGALTQTDLDNQLGPPASDSTVRFSEGQMVRVKPEQTKSRWRKPHLRVPGYIYNARGVIERVCGVFKNPEALAFNVNTDAVQPLYRVRFPMSEVWKAYPGPKNDSIDVEIYQHWLEIDGGTANEASDHHSPHEHAHGSGSHDHHSPHEHAHGAAPHDHDSSHDHSHSEAKSAHAHSHDGGPPHVHESRVQVEQTAVDREGPESPDEHFAKCLLAACITKGITTPAQLAELVERRDAIEGRGYGPTIVAKAWVDPEFKALLLKDAVKAVSPMVPLETELLAVENTEKVHNVRCTFFPRASWSLF
ncbi:hypothetical protein HDU93_000628 [Gonapodya sp. JEL0774]|nr:hypothetical protein HDU93_000628 [Gonapodya sp. JEL0774]